MRNYNQQIEDAYLQSKRQGDLMRDRQIERSSGQDRRNRYRDDRYQFPEEHIPFDNRDREAERTDRYGYERSNLNNSNFDRGNYPETYRSGMDGMMSVHVGEDRDRRDYGNTRQRDIPSRQTSGEHRGKGPRSYKRTDDRILEEINERMCDNPYLDASDVEVTVSDGDVILTGHVEDRDAKRLAEDIGEEVTGVQNVENRLHVRVRGI
jgi:hypothetical protein